MLHRSSWFSYGNEDRANELIQGHKASHRNHRAFDCWRSPAEYKSLSVNFCGAAATPELLFPRGIK